MYLLRNILIEDVQEDAYPTYSHTESKYLVYMLVYEAV